MDRILPQRDLKRQFGIKLALSYRQHPEVPLRFIVRFILDVLFLVFLRAVFLFLAICPPITSNLQEGLFFSRIFVDTEFVPEEQDATEENPRDCSRRDDIEESK